MFAGLQESQLEGALEALLFVTDEPVNAITLADMLEVEPAAAEAALGRLRDRLADVGSGIVLREVAGGWRLSTHPAFHDLVERYVVSWDTRKLSQAALETLAIVAYSQPVTRARISSVRGVNSDSSVNSLVEKGLLREAGVEDAPGNPVLYATTQTFLEKFGLRSTADLPPLASFAPDEETRRFILDRLSATRIAPGAAVPADLAAEEAFVLGADEDALAEAALEAEASEEGFFQDALFERSTEGAAGGAFAEDAAEASVESRGQSCAVAYERAERSEEENETMRRAMAEAMAQAVGAVEKIDFNELRFED